MHLADFKLERYFARFEFDAPYLLSSSDRLDPPARRADWLPTPLAPVPIARFAEELVAVEEVMLLPGTVYDHPGNYFRLDFARRNLPEALARLDRFCDARLGPP